MGKTVYAVFDQQKDSDRKRIEKAVDFSFEATELGIEDVVLKGVDQSALLKYGLHLVENNEWPSNLKAEPPRPDMSPEELYKAMKAFFKHKKGDGALAELIDFCSENEMPKFITDTILSIEKSVFLHRAESIATDGEL